MPVAHDPFRLEDLSAGGHQEPLPAGPEARWVVEMGRGRPGAHQYPPDGVLATIDRRERCRRDLARICKAWRALREWEPHGELLYNVVYTDCMAQPVTLDVGRGWKHQDKRHYRARVAAWEIIAVLAVEPAVLRAAQEAGAVDLRALEWARERGLVGDAV